MPKLQSNDIETQKQELENLLAKFDKNVIASSTDQHGVITYVSEAFCKICGYSEAELIGKKHNVLRHEDTPISAFDELWQTIKAKKEWTGEIKNQTKDGGFYWVKALISPKVDAQGEITGFDSVLQDITDKKAFEALSARLEYEVGQKTKDMQKLLDTLIESEKLLRNEVEDRKHSEHLATSAKKNLEKITDNIPGVVYQFQSICGVFMIKFISAGIKQLQNLEPKQLTSDSSLFLKSVYPDDQALLTEALDNAINTLSHLDCDYRVVDPSGQIKWIHMEATVTELVTKVKSFVFIDEEEGEVNVNLNGNLIDVTSARNAHELLIKQQDEIQAIHKQTRESIEYAALIQGSLIPETDIFQHFFQEYFTIWHPKDIVGGDIYLMEALNEDEVILMVIDCTGHGVPGAFVTMLVKAIERQLMANIHKDEIISPANMLAVFNRSIKHLLKQEDNESISNAGFDGGILYYNKKENIIRFSGADTPLFVFQDNKLTTIKGDRHSIGYKKSDENYQFTDHEIDLSSPTQIYVTTDGFLDQNGGENGFPFGKKRFIQTIEQHADKSFADQQEYLLYELKKYQKDYDRNDDITMVGLKL